MTPQTPPRIRHVLFIRFKPEVKFDQIVEVMFEFLELRRRIAGIEAVEWGGNNSPERLDKGYTHVLEVTFIDEQARDAYLPHPEHKRFKTLFVPLLDDIIVMDFNLPS
ncbi:Dabb family protein [Aliagarivorans taiwanensis]|uniref:Dabb family protein n=1 Tax=Aliagarivorans taiwanensis TaxID=561966 RepID=UPI0003F97CE6|nr:Dabb family protein [Aliagarivorans taiwanensis]